MNPSPSLGRRRFLLLAGIGAASGLLAACQGAAQTPAPTTAPAPKPTSAPAPTAQPTAAQPAAAATTTPAVSKPTTLALPKPELTSWPYGVYSPAYVNAVLHTVALENGYLTDAGFDKIEVIVGEQYLAGTVGGGLLLAFGETDPIFAASAKGEPLTYLGPYRDKEERNLGVRKGIETPADLKGAKLSGGAVNSRNTFNMKALVKKAGLDPEKDVEWISLTGSDATLQAIVAGQLDGGSLFPRHKKPLEDAGGKFLLSERSAVPQDGFFVRTDTVNKYPNLIVSYLAAITRARQFALEDPATVLKNKDAVLAMMEKNGFKIPDNYKLAYEADMALLSADGGFTPESMDQLVQESKDQGNIPKDLDWRKVVNVSLLNKAQVAVGLPANPKL